MEADKQAIIANRQRLRLSIKSICTVEDSLSGKLNWKTETEQKQSGHVRRRRKTVENFEAFQSMSTFKDVMIMCGFNELFQLKGMLGQGYQSTVYRCVEIQTGSSYAVKIAKKKDLELLQNMLLCYKMLRQLSHQNIVSGKYLFLDEKKLTCHLVEEYIQYPNLRIYMNKCFTRCKEQNIPCMIEEGIIADILKSVFNCLNYMVEMGVCHRDIKPDNILYDPLTGDLKIIDFDLGKMRRYKHEKVSLLSHCGTLTYRAPQTFKGQYGVEIDTWSAGIIAFEMLTGILPFKSNCHKDTINNIMNKQLNFQDYDLPGYAKAFLARLLDKYPESRMTPKEALSHPFMLKNTSPTMRLKEKFRKKYSSLSQDSLSSNEDSEELRAYTPSRFYDADMTFSEAETMSIDLGVRFCGQQKRKS